MINLCAWDISKADELFVVSLSIYIRINLFINQRQNGSDTTKDKGHFIEGKHLKLERNSISYFCIDKSALI